MSARPAAAWSIAALALYGLSAARGPMWADSSKLALYALRTYLPSLNPGDHSGWTVLAVVWLHLVPWLDPVRALHLLSAVAGAATVGSLWAWVERQTGERARAHAAAAVLLVALPHWWASSLTETYTVAAALVLAAALATRGGTALAALGAGLLAGLAAATHLFTVMLTAPLLAALPPRRWPVVALGVAGGAAPIWLAAFVVSPDPLTGHLAGSVASWGWHTAAFVSARRLVGNVVVLGALAAYALGPVGVLGAVRGARRPAHPAPRLAAAGLLALVAVLATYSPFRLHLMVGLPLLGFLLLAPPRLGPLARAAHVVVQVAAYVAVPAALVAAGRGDLGARVLPERSNAWYFLNPVKALDDGPRRYAAGLLAACPPDAVVLADFNPGSVLRLLQETAGVRPDVCVRPTVIDEALAAADPAAALTALVAELEDAGRPAVLADRWEPYYRTDGIRARGWRLRPLGPGLLVARDP